MINNASLIRLTLAFVWFYHGFFPKILFQSKGEEIMNTALGLSLEEVHQLSLWAGICEIVFALVIVLFWKSRLLIKINQLAMIGLSLFVALVGNQAMLMEAFNPVTTNLMMLVLGWVYLNITAKKQEVIL